ncbi:MAG: hypothetical protein ABI467_24540, partial [Kofleriaceae bacterium]
MWLAVELALHGDGRADAVVERCAIGTRAWVRPPEVDRCAIRRADPRAARVAALEQAVANGEHARRLHAIELDIDAARSIEMRPHDLTMIELEANDGVGAVARQELVSAVGARRRLVRGVVDFLGAQELEVERGQANLDFIRDRHPRRSWQRSSSAGDSSRKLMWNRRSRVTSSHAARTPTTAAAPIIFMKPRRLSPAGSSEITGSLRRCTSSFMIRSRHRQLVHCWWAAGAVADSIEGVRRVAVPAPRTCAVGGLVERPVGRGRLVAARAGDGARRPVRR